MRFQHYGRRGRDDMLDGFGFETAKHGDACDDLKIAWGQPGSHGRQPLQIRNRNSFAVSTKQTTTSANSFDLSQSAPGPYAIEFTMAAAANDPPKVVSAAAGL
jgi:hypothetical protein